MRLFCECERMECRHGGNVCGQTKRLALCRVGGFRQTLCPKCAEMAEQCCDAYGHRFYRLEESRAHRRKAWRIGDWVCAGVLLAAVTWILVTILPAFLDGRVAQAVGR